MGYKVLTRLGKVLVRGGKVVVNSVSCVGKCCNGQGSDPPYWIYMKELCAPSCDQAISAGKYYRVDPRDQYNAGQTWADWLATQTDASGCIIIRMAGKCYVLSSPRCNFLTRGCNPDSWPVWAGFGGPRVDPSQNCESCSDCCDTGVQWSCVNNAYACHECGKSWTARETISASYRSDTTPEYQAYQRQVDPGQCLPTGFDDFRTYGLVAAWETTCEPNPLGPGNPGISVQRQTQCQTQGRTSNWGYRVGGCQYIFRDYNASCLGLFLNGSSCSGVTTWDQFVFDASGALDFMPVDLRWWSSTYASPCRGSHDVTDGDGSTTHTEWTAFYTDGNIERYTLTQTRNIVASVGNNQSVVASRTTLTINLVCSRVRGPACNLGDGCAVPDGGSLGASYINPVRGRKTARKSMVATTAALNTGSLL